MSSKNTQYPDQNKEREELTEQFIRKILDDCSKDPRRTVSHEKTFNAISTSQEKSTTFERQNVLFEPYRKTCQCLGTEIPEDSKSSVNLVSSESSPTHG